MQAAHRVETWKRADLRAYDRNSRTHSPEQVEQLVRSIKEWGWTVPILIDGSGQVIAGHGRLMAAEKLGMTDIPCVVADGWTEAQKRAYVIADNKLAENAGWDEAMLAGEFAWLSEAEFDLGLTGFSDENLAQLLALPGGGLTDPDEVPPVPEVSVSLPGDVWCMGRHRLICGDSTSAMDVAKLMAGQSADLCFTSPPYAQQRQYKAEISDWDGLMSGAFGGLPVKHGAQVLVNLGLIHNSGRVDCYWDKWLTFMESADWPLFGWYVWDKGFGLPGNWNGRLAPSHEFIFHFSHGGNKPANKWVDKKPESIGKIKRGTGIRRADGTMSGISSPEAGKQPTKIMDSVIRITPHMGRQNVVSHPAIFPVALCDAIYKSYAKAGDWVFEPFSGSGTSIIACEQFGANCAAIELAPAYVDVAVLRWQDFTGHAAVLDGTTRTFAEIAKERAAG